MPVRVVLYNGIVMKKVLIVIVSLMSVTVIASCGAAEHEKVGGPCRYNKIPGRITITSLEKVTDSESAGGETVTVMFTFAPADHTARTRYAFPRWSDENRELTVGGCRKPDREWVERREIAVGRRYRATRNEIRSGTCTPVAFESKAIISERSVDR